MLFVLFTAGSDTYAISSWDVTEIVPYARLKDLPGSHASVAGLLNLRGQPVPVVDLNIVLKEHPAALTYSTRIILCRNIPGLDEDRLLGFVAEHVTETRQIPEEAFSPAGFSGEGAPYAGQVYESPSGAYIQWIHPGKVLPPQVLRELQAQAEEVPL